MIDTQHDTQFLDPSGSQCQSHKLRKVGSKIWNKKVQLEEKGNVDNERCAGILEQSMGARNQV